MERPVPVLRAANNAEPASPDLKPSCQTHGTLNL